MRLPSPTLGQVFGLSILGLSALLGVLFYLLLSGSKEALLKSSERPRDMASREVELRVKEYLFQAKHTLLAFEHSLQQGVFRPDDLEVLEAQLFASLLDKPRLTEATLTLARRSEDGFANDGTIFLEDAGRAQISVYRKALRSSQPDPIETRLTRQEGTRFVSYLRARPSEGSFNSAKLVRLPGEAPDPTKHLTFETPSSEDYYGAALWSDLHWTQLDDALPEAQRRVVVTVQKTLEDKSGRFIGVLRVGLSTDQLDRVADLRVDDKDQHRIFICDNKGRLITRTSPEDVVGESGDDLRVLPKNCAPQIAGALQQVALTEVCETNPYKTARITIGNEDYLASYRCLTDSQGWVVGIVVPESFYLGDLVEARTRLLQASATVMGFTVLLGVLTLRFIRRGLALLDEQTSRMSDFHFEPNRKRSPFSDMNHVLDSLERSKTALRAMVKYVPIDLVRDLYRANAEPELGSQMREVTLMFTDIRDFTTLAERIGSDRLAGALGRYLQVMTDEIHRFHGTIDKYVGDAVMAMWNAPSPCHGHSVQACYAALQCVEVTKRLYESPEWAGLPPLETRFGLHKDTVQVGHFGAPMRLSYTAIGDGVNLASRLEGLNKVYGTTILVTNTVYEEARKLFIFRRLDRVAVKGRMQSVDIYELIGTRAEAERRVPQVRTYEKALQQYFDRDFEGALKTLREIPDDIPGQVLAERCRSLSQAPPAPEWDGVFVASSK